LIFTHKIIITMDINKGITKFDTMWCFKSNTWGDTKHTLQYIMPIITLFLKTVGHVVGRHHIGITKHFKKFRPAFYQFHFQINTLLTNQPNFFLHYIHVMHRGWLSKYSPWELHGIPPMKVLGFSYFFFLVFFNDLINKKCVYALPLTICT
jgi:hypothetical protein